MHIYTHVHIYKYVPIYTYMFVCMYIIYIYTRLHIMHLGSSCILQLGSHAPIAGQLAFRQLCGQHRGPLGP